MIRKIIKKSSKRVFLLYAVIWGFLIPVFIWERCAFSQNPPEDVAEEPAVSIEEIIHSLDDPFDVQVRAPEMATLFLDGLAELKRQLAAKEKPIEEKVVPSTVVQPVVAPPVVPAVVQEPVKPKKLQIPEMKITGIMYETDRPQAIINGKVVSVGSTVDGVLIVKIQKGRIDVRFEGADITLKFNNE
jgi:hypothetical protein